VVLPGRAPETSFGASARRRSQTGIPEAYADLATQAFSAAPQSSDCGFASNIHYFSPMNRIDIDDDTMEALKALGYVGD
jgi:hypothetical protein